MRRCIGHNVLLHSLLASRNGLVSFPSIMSSGVDESRAGCVPRQPPLLHGCVPRLRCHRSPKPRACGGSRPSPPQDRDRSLARILAVGLLALQTSRAAFAPLWVHVGTIASAVAGPERATGRAQGFGSVTISPRAEGQAASTPCHGQDGSGCRAVTLATSAMEAGVYSVPSSRDYSPAPRDAPHSRSPRWRAGGSSHSRRPATVRRTSPEGIAWISLS
jgi:hypothetical protein